MATYIFLNNFEFVIMQNSILLGNYFPIAQINKIKKVFPFTFAFGFLIFLQQALILF